MEATYLAHRGRLDEVHGSVEAWTEAAATAESAGTRWWQTEALVSLARCHLLDRDTASAAQPLRVAHELCEQMGAEALRHEVEAMARSARISLARPVTSTPLRSAAPSIFDRLTARESEILGHLVAGRTYREIAEQLFISEKTVSVHVSNMLRKTGTSTRLEVSELAREVASEGSGPAN